MTRSIGTKIYSTAFCLILGFGRTAVAADWDFSYAKSLPYLTNTMTLFENVIIDGAHYNVKMQSSFSGVMKPVYKQKLKTVTIPTRTITIDGDRSDWAGLLPVINDPKDDKDDQYDNLPWTDLNKVYMARDNDYLYFLMTVYDYLGLDLKPTLPDTNALYFVELQQYLNQLHTFGDVSVNVGYDLSALKWRVTVAARPGFIMATIPPEFVQVGSNFFEWKVPIAAFQYPPNNPLPYNSPVPTSPGIENQFIRAYIHPGPHPTTGQPPSDENNPSTRPMIVNFYP